MVVSLARTVFAAAVADGKIARSPALRVSMPRTEKQRVIPLTVEQVRALEKAMPERSRAMVVAPSCGSASAWVNY